MIGFPLSCHLSVATNNLSIWQREGSNEIKKKLIFSGGTVG
jgi:hypothetical protein